jgi:hypothetical protein
MQAPTGSPGGSGPLRARPTIWARAAAAIAAYPRDSHFRVRSSWPVHSRSTNRAARSGRRTQVGRTQVGRSGRAFRPGVQAGDATARRRPRDGDGGGPGSAARSPGNRNAQRNRRFLSDPSAPMQAREPTCRCKHRRDQQVFEAPLGKPRVRWRGPAPEGLYPRVSDETADSRPMVHRPSTNWGPRHARGYSPTRPWSRAPR